MPRSVNHVASRARRKRVLEFAKGYWGRRKNVWTVAKNAVEKGWTYAYRDRKSKKRNFRGLWIQRINAATRMHDLSYSKFMSMFHNSGLELNRKVLADLAMNHGEAFKSVVDYVKANGEKKVEVKTSSNASAQTAAPKAKKPAAKKEAVAAAEAVEETAAPQEELTAPVEEVASQTEENVVEETKSEEETAE